jgi:hypothetical protein
MSDKNTRERALKNAFASARMEGFKITPETVADSKRLLSGEISTSDLVAERRSKRVDNKPLQ